MEEFKVGLKKVAVGCYVFNRITGKMLMLKRAKEPHKGQYIAGGGKLEPFEDPTTCVVREIFEETGLRIESPRLAGVLAESSPTKFNWMLWFYRAEIDETEIKPCEEGVYEWIDSREMLQKDIPECDRFITKDVLDGRFFVYNAIYDADIKLVKITDELTGQVVFEKR